MGAKKFHVFEHHHQKIAPLPVFLRRMMSYLGAVLLLILAALSFGVLGYHFFAGLDWLDALLNASMILGGMGPVDPLTSVPAKFFASFYAIFSGVFFIALMGILFTPIMHRVLHKFHVDEKNIDSK